MGIAVKLQAFEGPLDLLLHLIEKNKVSIYDIPIAEITDQYMAYLHEMKKQDLGVMSEFLLMAATLLDIKSRMLLPKEVNEEGEEEDPRQELVQQLLEYKMYKYISYELKERRQDAAQVLYHKQDLPEEVKAYLIRFSLAVANAYRAKHEISSEAVLMDLTMGLGQAVSWNKIEQSIDGFLNQLSFDVMRLGQTREFSPMVQKAAEMARKYFDQGLTLEETASQLYVSEEYLSTQFKKETGVGFAETVRRYRIEKIKELLLGTKLKLNQISELVGYSDPKYMSKVFKEEIGMLPSEYRKNIN